MISIVFLRFEKKRFGHAAKKLRHQQGCRNCSLHVRRNFWRTFLEKKTKFQVFTRTVQRSFWGESLFWKEFFLIFHSIFLKLTIFRVTKSKKLGGAVKTEFYVSWGTFWGEFVFVRKKVLNLIVEAKSFRSSSQKNAAEILKLKFSCPQENSQESFSSKILWFRKFFLTFCEKDPETRLKTFDINKVDKTAFYCPVERSEVKCPNFVKKNEVSKI